MRAGLLREKITIQQVTETQDAYGEADQTWSTFRVVRAARRNLGGDENEVNSKRSPTRTVEFRLHYLAGVTNKMRVLHGSDTFDILFIDNLNNMNRDLILTCREIV